MENYRPVSFLIISGKITEHLQLLSINHEILSAFDMKLEVRGIFLDIFKAFDKVWCDRLIFKLRQNGVYDEIISF